MIVIKLDSYLLLFSMMQRERSFFVFLLRRSEVTQSSDMNALSVNYKKKVRKEQAKRKEDERISDEHL